MEKSESIHSDEKRPVLAIIPVEDVATQLATIVKEDVEEEFVLPRQEEGVRSPRHPEVRIEVLENALLVRFVGNNKARQVVGMTLGEPPQYLAGEEKGPVIRIAQPFGSDAVAKFRLQRPLPEFPVVHVNWEQPIQLGVGGADRPTDEEPVRVWAPTEVSEEEIEQAFKDKGCKKEVRNE